jgi:2'-5' RNA ligase
MEDALDETQRIFIAIDLLPEIRRWLGNAQLGLQSAVPAGTVRWVEVGGIHLTLKFLGEIPAGRIDAVRGAMDRSREGVQPFSLTVEGVGCFPNIVRPRVVWAGVRGEPLLGDLQRRLEDNLQAAGFQKELRAFSPHLTLGRVKDGASDAQLRKIGAAVGSAQTDPPAAMDVSALCLFRSVLRPQGSQYSILYRVEISGQ